MTPNDAFFEFAATLGTWLRRDHGLWMVTDRVGKVPGFVLIGFEPNDAEPELGFLFCPDARGRGYLAEAAAAARIHGLETLHLPSLVSYIAPGNAASHRVAKRLGARRDGNADEASDPEPSEIWLYAPKRTNKAEFA